jgi:thiol-disulfide isomerase/thioredoxin
LVALLFGGRIQREFFTFLVLHSASTTEAVVHDLVNQAAQPERMLDRLWGSRRLSQRRLVINYLRDRVPADAAFFPRVRALVLEAAHDADEDVRELAFSLLTSARDPELPTLAQALLTDADPDTRMQGLRYLQRSGDSRMVPVVIPFLDDTDPRVIASASNVLRKWTGLDFGLRVAQTLRRVRGEAYEEVSAGTLENVHAAVARWKEWWTAHQLEYTPAASLPVAAGKPLKLRATGFALADLEGRVVKLSDFRGKTVLLNFWATWCPSCLLDIADLNELQRRQAERLVVLGVSLDGVRHSHEPPDPAGKPLEPVDVAKVRQVVRQVVEQRGITYRVLLDPTGQVGVCYHGFELPTNVLIDPEGHVRRRFVGGRSVAAFEAMIRQVDGAVASVR